MPPKPEPSALPKASSQTSRKSGRISGAKRSSSTASVTAAATPRPPAGAEARKANAEAPAEVGAAVSSGPPPPSQKSANKEKRLADSAEQRPPPSSADPKQPPCKASAATSPHHSQVKSKSRPNRDVNRSTRSSNKRGTTGSQDGAKKELQVGHSRPNLKARTGEDAGSTVAEARGAAAAGRPADGTAKADQAPAVQSKPVIDRQKGKPHDVPAEAFDPRTDAHDLESSFSPADPKGIKKSALASAFYESFFPLDVPFITEVDTKQERFLLATGMVVTAVFIVIGLCTVVLVFMIRNYSRLPEPCETSECFQARDYLVGLLNTSKDACSDFYGYVCDLWLARHKDSNGVRSFVAERVDDSLAALDDYLRSRDEAPEVAAGSPGRPLRQLVHEVYRKCHQHIFDNSTAPPFQARLEAARKELDWASIRGAGSIHQLVALLARTSLLAGFHTIFALRVLRDNGQPTLELSCGASLRRKMAAVGALGDFERSMQRIVQKASELTRIISLDALVDIAIDSVDCSAPARNKSLNAIFDNLVPGVTARGWLEALNDTMKSAKIGLRLTDMGLVSGLKSLSDAFRVVDSHATFPQAGMYLASHIDAELLVLELHRGQGVVHPETTTHFCLGFARRCLPDAWPQLMTSALALEKSVQVLKDMFGELKVSSHHAAFLSWLPEEHLDALLEMIDKSALVTAFSDAQASGLGGGAGGASSVDVDVDGKDEGILMFYVRLLSRASQRLLRHLPERVDVVTSRLGQGSELVYAPALGAVVVPAVFQRPPLLYVERVPAYFNYGTVGALLATRIFERVGPMSTESEKATEHRPEDEHGGGIGWTQSALSRFAARGACLQRLHRRLGLQHLQQEASSASEDEQSRHMVLRAQGLRIAYDALMAVFRESVGRADAFAALWPDAQRMFFARFCLLSCDAGQRSDPLSPRSDCLLPLHSMPEFGEAFGCSDHPDFHGIYCLV